MILAAFICIVASVTDGDTLRCADGTRIRIAAIEANERSGGCHLPVCPPLPLARAKQALERIALGRRLSCRQVDVSYNRIVADCRPQSGPSLSCSLIAVGAAVRWDRYWRAYRMGDCRG